MILNEITIAGNAGIDVDVKMSQGGKEWAQFTLCHTEKNKETQVETSTWVRVKAFGWCVNDAKLVTKGSNVIVKGKLQVGQYKDKQGVDRTSVDVLAHQIGVIQKAPRQQQAAASEPSLEDIPF